MSEEIDDAVGAWFAHQRRCTRCTTAPKDQCAEGKQLTRRVVGAAARKAWPKAKDR